MNEIVNLKDADYLSSLCQFPPMVTGDDIPHIARRYTHFLFRIADRCLEGRISS